MNRLSEQIIVDILKKELSLASDRVWIRNQNRKIPKDENLFIAVGMADAQVFTNTTTTEDIEGGLMEVQRMNIRENIQIDIFSRNTDAIMRRYEVMAALKSFYAQQMQEENSFKIFRIPGSFVDASDAEGSSQLNRFSIVIPCHIWYLKKKLITGNDYYNDFDTRVDDERSIGTVKGIIEFNIKEEA